MGGAGLAGLRVSVPAGRPWAPERVPPARTRPGSAVAGASPTLPGVPAAGPCPSDGAGEGGGSPGVAGGPAF